MPKVFLNDADRICSREHKKLHGELMAEGVTNRQIASWLNCTAANVGQRWKNCSFSYRQILIMQHELERIRMSDGTVSR